MSSDLPFPKIPEQSPFRQDSIIDLPEFQLAANPVVSIVIPVWNLWGFTLRCLNTIRQNTHGVAYEVIVVDNGSTDDTLQNLPKIKGIQIVRNETNQGFGKASNQGARAAKGRYVLFLNNDTEAMPGWLLPLVQILDEEPGIGVVGAKLLYPDGTLQHAGVAVSYGNPYPITVRHVHVGKPAEVADKRLDLLVVTGACMLIRTSLCWELGGFDEGYLNGYEDVDLCFKVQEAGFGVAFSPESQLIHHESKTPGRLHNMDQNCDLFHRRWLARTWELAKDLRPARRFEVPPQFRDPLSVIVLSKDSLETIVLCLEALTTQLTFLDQLILSDEDSKDSTPIFLSLFASELSGIASVVHANDDSAHAARSALWLASHPCVVILPAAFIPPPDYLHTIYRRFVNSGKSIQIFDLDAGIRVMIGLIPDLLALSKIQVTDC